MKNNKQITRTILKSYKEIRMYLALQNLPKSPKKNVIEEETLGFGK